MSSQHKNRNGRHEPFHFRKEGNRYRGRGTTDDKGPALTALFAAKYAMEEDIPLNLRFLWELEEEIWQSELSGCSGPKKTGVSARFRVGFRYDLGVTTKAGHSHWASRDAVCSTVFANRNNGRTFRVDRWWRT